MIVTTNYDAALERAFDQAGVPYELVVFMAAGEHAGRFVHDPWPDGKPAGCTPITDPNGYLKFPIAEDTLELERTVIVRLHGGGADLQGCPTVPDNFIVTEDDYIGYLTEHAIGQFIPLQILNKITTSQLLFLAYPVREWPARVFLQRVWGGGRLGANSTAVDPAPTTAEKLIWRDLGVDVIEQAVPEFVDALDHALAARVRATQAP